MTDNLVELPVGQKPKKRPPAGNAVRKYTDEQRAYALTMYQQHGSALAEAETGIDKTTITHWAREAGVTTSVTEKNLAARDAWSAKSAELRERARYLAHERLVEMLERMDEPYIDFKGNAGTRRVYPKPPAEAVRNFTMSFAVLLDKIRLEEGKSTSNVAVDFRSRVEHIAQQLGLDPNEVMVEAEVTLKELGVGQDD